MSADQMFINTIKKLGQSPLDTMKALAEVTSQELVQAKVSLAVEQALMDMKKAKIKEMEKALGRGKRKATTIIAAKTTRATERKKKDSILRKESCIPMNYATKPATTEGTKRKAADCGVGNTERA